MRRTQNIKKPGRHSASKNLPFRCIVGSANREVYIYLCVKMQRGAEGAEEKNAENAEDGLPTGNIGSAAVYPSVNGYIPRSAACMTFGFTASSIAFIFFSSAACEDSSSRMPESLNACKKYLFAPFISLPIDAISSVV